MKLFIIGYMGCGKSTIGKKIAHQLSLPFYDLDKEIEQKIQYSIFDFFEKFGEAEFRKVEKDTLQMFLRTSEDCVIATGGGTPCFFDNMENMLKNGVCVYIKKSPKLLANRLIQAKQKRPLIKNKTQIKQHRQTISSCLIFQSF